MYFTNIPSSKGYIHRKGYLTELSPDFKILGVTSSSGEQFLAKFHIASTECSFLLTDVGWVLQAPSQGTAKEVLSLVLTNKVNGYPFFYFNDRIAKDTHHPAIDLASLYVWSLMTSRVLGYSVLDNFAWCGEVARVVLDVIWADKVRPDTLTWSLNTFDRENAVTWH